MSSLFDLEQAAWRKQEAVVTSAAVLCVTNYLCFVDVLLQQQDGIMATLAAVLHISDIVFDTDPQTDGVFVKNDDVLVLGECYF